MARSLVWGGEDFRVVNTLRYSDGSIHGAWDVMMPIGTPIRACGDGTIVALADGVKNHRPGPRRTWSGMPSNWVLLRTSLMTNYGTRQQITVMLQHLSPGIPVEVGQKVQQGEIIGYSGDTGRSSGPHLHIGAQWVPRGQKASASQRWDHLNSAERRVWPLERILKGTTG
jgi:murein DD-endopeptidase MepM/ murein hydrolase activator NlpD